MPSTATSPGPTRVSHHRIHDLENALAGFATVLQEFGVRCSGAVHDELKGALHELTRPGPYLAFTHGDATPANAFVSGVRVRLFDWETGGFRHALLDGSFARLRYLHSVWARRIPSSLQRRMLSAYREELLKGFAAAAEPGRFDFAHASCCAAWLAGLCRFLPDVVERDKKFGRSTLRQRIIAGFEHFIALANETDLFPALAEAVGKMATRLRSLWPAEDQALPLYRALAASPPEPPTHRR